VEAGIFDLFGRECTPDRQIVPVLSLGLILSQQAVDTIGRESGKSKVPSL
jgi:hypothetical protein